MAESEDGAVPLAATSKAPISFGFTRMSRRRLPAELERRVGQDSEEKDFLKTVEGRQLQSVNPPEAPKELVIPLIHNGFRRQSRTPTLRPASAANIAGDSVLSQAVKELIEESKKSLEERENTGVDPMLTIPMLREGCVATREGPDSESQDDTMPEEANYEAIPVEAYGLAMLRGMGWKPGEGIGHTFNQVVKPRVNSLRPKGLGLGANLMEAQALTSTGSCHLPRPGEQEKEKEGAQGLVPGGAVLILSGRYRGLYGKVEGLDPDNARAMVRLAAGKRIATVSEYCLRPVSQEEFDSNTLCPGQANKTSSEQQNRTTGTVQQEDSERSRRDSERSRKDSERSRRDSERSRRDSERSRRDSERSRKHPPDRQNGPVVKSEKSACRNKHWLHRDLRVRFVDKLHKGGRYYNTKMIIEDVLSPDTCVCRTDEGRILEGLREDMLETLVPKEEGYRVMVVLGPHAGKIGQLLNRDKERSRAFVQLRRENRVVKLHYDDICQYMGPSDSDED